MDNDLISIIIPCRNEEKFITGCLNSVLSFELPEDYRTEIFVVDGDSTDCTLERIVDLQKKFSNIKVLRNERIYQSYAINVALQYAQGAWVMRLDAHSYYPTNYLKLCLETSLRTGAENVGGLFITQPGNDSYQAQLVQALTTHSFGVGNSGFRTGKGDGPADTVPYGFFRRSVFEMIGMMNERLVRAQDYEFNSRIIKSGGKVWRNPKIEIFYHNQPTLFAFYKKQLLKEAPYNAYLWYVAPYAFSIRHAITGLFSCGVICGILLSPFSKWVAIPFGLIMLLYLVLALISSGQQAIRYKKPLHFLFLPACFFLYHFVHGIGVIGGVVLLLAGKSPVQKVNSDQ
jgi:glycosyltransferase involved in cell wall biosynthesis